MVCRLGRHLDRSAALACSPSAHDGAVEPLQRLDGGRLGQLGLGRAGLDLGTRRLDRRLQGRHLELQLPHHLGQLAVAGREARRQPQLLQRADQVGLAPVEIAERAPGREVVGGRPRDDVQLALGLIVEPELHQAAPERDPRGHVGRVEPKPGAARFDGFVEAGGAPVFLGERGEGDGRRVGFDPALQLLEACRLAHGANFLRRTTGRR